MKFKGKTKWIFLAQPTRVSKCCGAVASTFSNNFIFCSTSIADKMWFCAISLFTDNRGSMKIFSFKNFDNFFYKVIVTIIREQTIFFRYKSKYVGHFTCESNKPSWAAVVRQPHTSSWPRLIENKFRRTKPDTYRVKTLLTTRFTQFLDWIFLKI